MAEAVPFERVGSAWVARNPQSIGVIEFYGGAIFERCPTLFYEEYLEGLFEAGYTIVAFIYPVSFDHTQSAVDLVAERSEVFARLDLPAPSSAFPHIWVGHSVGCKIIALLQILLTDTAAGNAMQPALLLAPDISGTDAAVPGPLAKVIDFLGFGVKPTEPQTKMLISERCNILTNAGLISFDHDTIAGNADGSLPKNGKSSVEWFIKTLSARGGVQSLPFFTHVQLPGGHLAPLGYDFESRLRVLLSGVGRRTLGRSRPATGRVAAIVQASLGILAQLQARIPS